MAEDGGGVETEAEASVDEEARAENRAGVESGRNMAEPEAAGTEPLSDGEGEREREREREEG